MDIEYLSYYETDKQPVLRLAHLWCCLRDSFYGITQQSLTPKEMGQLKFLRKCLGPWAALVIYWTIKNWQRFCEQTRLEDGLPSAPLKPHIGFLIAHWVMAVDQMHTVAQNTKAVTDAESRFVQKMHQMMDELMKKQQEESQMWEEMENNCANAGE
jgi:hypothetical protein